MRLAVLLALFLAAACIRETPDVSQNDPSKSTTVAEPTPQETSTLNDPRMPQSDAPANSATGAALTQEVHLIEYDVRMPQTLPAGRIAFNIENGGKEQHGFAIEGMNVQSPVVYSGSTAAVEADLKPGTYTVYCPVKGHKEKGMSTTVTVK
jgi:uncharacterized cupredoxin-like copper-binding protein